MPLTPPNEVIEALAALDARTDLFLLMDVASTIEKAIPEPKTLTADQARGKWAEWMAFDFQTHGASNGGPWNTYFQPLGTIGVGDGMVCRPDLRQADDEVIAHWSKRAHESRHPVLKARYADLVWDATKFVTGGKPGIELARMAIDNYMDAARLDKGDRWTDTHEYLGRALTLALSIKDADRAERSVEATIEFVDRTASGDSIGTFGMLYDRLLSPESGPELSERQERKIIERMEARFAELTMPGDQRDIDPHSPQNLGNRLAAYYQRKGRAEDRVRILRGIGQAFERRAKLGIPLMRVMFLNEAREIYADAGLKEEAERVQFEAQLLTPEAVKGMPRITVEHRIEKSDVDQFLSLLMQGGLDKAVARLVVDFIPDQTELAAEVERRNQKFPIQAMCAGTVIDESHIKADLRDDSGDPDGRMVYETSRHIQLQSIWIAWAFDHMFVSGLTAAHMVDFVGRSPLFTIDRLPLVRRGVEAHILGDYVQAIHILIPQIERALVNLALHAGKPTTKPFQSGKGVMQAKNLQDVLERDETLRDVLGDMRIYLLAALAHPKGLNIRNDVCHGLWSVDQFTKAASERVLHTLLCVSMFRPVPVPSDAHAETASPESTI
jgi:lysyl-tRNA synthetase, class I